MNDVKHQVLEAIRASVDVFRNRGLNEFSIRCPICGDSQTDSQDSHCYIKCSEDPSDPMVWNCFKCNKGGRVNSWFLKQLNIDPNIISLISNSRYMKITTAREADVEIITGEVVMNSPQVKYINERLGEGFTEEDFSKFKILWNIENLREIITNQAILNTLPSNRDSISFISDSKALLLTRNLEEDQEFRWRKRPLFAFDSKSFYSIKTTIDIFSSEGVTVNIAEGIFDVLSIYKNFNDSTYGAFIAALGSDYISAVDYAISKGLYGKNIKLRIYMDSDVPEKSLCNELKRYKWIYDSITVYRNIKGKDVGVTIDKIQLSERRI